MVLTSIYHDTIPAYLSSYLKSNALQRLKKVSMDCGVNYTSFPIYKDQHFYSRYEHSLNVAMILEHFTHEPKQVLAGLFHDISTPAFSHTIDFMNGDHILQESYEGLNVQFIQNDPIIMSQLNNDQINLVDVSNYKIYPIADNSSPCLSADRLEYTLSNGCYYKFINASLAKQIYDDITIMTNEAGNDELCFLHSEMAVTFSKLSLQCGKIYSAKENRYAMDILAQMIKKAVFNKNLTRDDLFKDDAYVISVLNHTTFKKDWSAFQQLEYVDTYSMPVAGSIVVDAKKRYIDPLILNCGRVSNYSAIIKDEIIAFQNEDYTKEYLKGVNL